ncbi:hypothetical protein [Acinetobacter beijerinckii]|uniref:hypothetical protein n=1 Tax=Acinetobacter beijerinckii TaxID=262668 RepID=UPI003AF42264
MQNKKLGWDYWLVFWSIMAVSFSVMLFLFKPFLMAYMPIFNLLSSLAVSIDSMPVFFIVGIIHMIVIGAYIAFFPFLIANKIVDYIYPNSRA